MRALLTLTALAIALPAAAQDFAITNAKLATMGPDGIIEGGTLVVDDGRIAAAGADINIPANIRVIDAKGRWVTPGLFNAMSTIASVEVGAVGATRDNRADDSVDFSAAFDIAYGINPKATAVPVGRIEGLTRAAVNPLPGGDSLFGGYGALVVLDETKPHIVTHSKTFMVAALGEFGARIAGSARGAAMVSLINSIEEAARYRDARNKAEWEGAISVLDARALVPVTTGEVPLVLLANRASDITQIIKLSQTYTKLDIVIVGAAEGWLVAEELAAANIPVIIDPTDNLPGSFETLGATQQNAKRLIEAGVLTAFRTSSFDSHLAHLVKQVAGNAVANGLAHEEALKAITVNPAEIFSVADQLGSLQPGRIADIVIWDGDPLEIMANPDHVFIAGEERPLVSRQTKLRDRYRDLDPALPHAYQR